MTTAEERAKRNAYQKAWKARQPAEKIRAEWARSNTSHYNNPEWVERNNARRRERRATDPEHREKLNSRVRENRLANPEKWKVFDKAKYAKNPELFRARMKARWDKDPKRAMLNLTRARAKAASIEFSITKEDFEIPTHCPILGIELKRGQRHGSPTSPTIDRIDATRGYVPGNIWIISWRANRLKSDGTKEEHQLIVSKGYPSL